MPEFHSEPFLTVSGVTHKSVLIAWGAFYFRIRGKEGDLKLVDDGDLKNVHPPRSSSIGANSKPYGNAVVEVLDRGGRVVSSAITNAYNYCWVIGLEPDTEYSYRVVVNGEEWGAGQRNDWLQGEEKMGLLPGGRYNNRFRTHPHPQQPAAGPLTFAIIGDFGTGVKKADRPQAKIARLLQKAVEDFNVRFVVTTGDNIYAGKRLLGIPIGATGDEDDDWYFTYYQPYRYFLNQIPVYPTIGNHDSKETEERDDRAQVMDNFFIEQRIAGEEAAGRATRGPGLFYQFRYGSEIEFVCVDTSKERSLFKGGRLFQETSNLDYLKSAFPDKATVEGAPAWKIPFCHHPPFSAGPYHFNTTEMKELLPLFQRAGVRVMFSGHEHNFQHSQSGNIDYFVTGAAGKLRDGKPKKFAEAHTVSWCPVHHFLLVTIEGRQMTIRAIGGMENNKLTDIRRVDPNLMPVAAPIVLQLP